MFPGSGNENPAVLSIPPITKNKVCGHPASPRKQMRKQKMRKLLTFPWDTKTTKTNSHLEHMIMYYIMYNIVKKLSEVRQPWALLNRKKNSTQVQFFSGPGPRLRRCKLVLFRVSHPQQQVVWNQWLDDRQKTFPTTTGSWGVLVWL